MAVACFIHDAIWRSSTSSTDSRSTPRESLPIPIGATGGTGECRAAPEGELDMALEAAARKARAVADAIPGHAPLHGALQVRQRLGRQGVDSFGVREAELVGQAAGAVIASSASLKRDSLVGRT